MKSTSARGATDADGAPQTRRSRPAADAKPAEPVPVATAPTVEGMSATSGPLDDNPMLGAADADADADADTGAAKAA